MRHNACTCVQKKKTRFLGKDDNASIMYYAFALEDLQIIHAFLAAGINPLKLSVQKLTKIGHENV